MIYRRTAIYAPADPGGAQTLIIPLYVKELISAFHVYFALTVHTVSVMKKPLADAISKIELVDGSTILFSLSGPEAVASNFYRTGRPPRELVDLTAGNQCWFTFDILFGRYLWDNMLAWDPTKFVQPQLRITYDPTVVNTGVTAEKLAVYASIIDNPSVAPTGIILAKDQTQYALAASTHQYIDLPLDYPISMIGLRLASDDYSPAGLMSNYKFSRDQDAFIWYDQDATQYKEELYSLFPPFALDMNFEDDVTADTIYAVQTEDSELQVNYDGTAFVTATSLFAVPTITGRKISLAASVTIKKLTGKITGGFPHGVVPFWFGDKNDPTTWYRPTPTTSFRADLASGANADSSDTGYLFTEQLRAY